MAWLVLALCTIFFVACQETCFSKNIVKRNVDGSLTIGSFNIQNLGNKKLSDEDVMRIVIQIILRYDIILIQEIVTKEQNRLTELLRSVNRLSKVGEVYDLKLSRRLGRGNAKEQYGYFYRSDKVRAISAEVYPDLNDDFMRPPYIVRFSTPTVGGLSSFGMIGIHTQPRNSPSEISSLVEVYNYFEKKYKTKDAVILGDMNAGCSNVRNRDWMNVDLWVDPRFVWLIGHGTDTTTNRNTCPYDRIVIAGDNINRAIVPNSARAFDFQKAYRLTGDQATSVSDHYPVQVKLKGK